MGTLVRLSSQQRNARQISCTSSGRIPFGRRSVAICRAEKASKSAPWSITNYYTKKKERKTGTLGEFLETEESVAEPVGWSNTSRKLELKCNIISDMDACHIDAQTLLKRCEVLAKVSEECKMKTKCLSSMLEE